MKRLFSAMGALVCALCLSACVSARIFQTNVFTNEGGEQVTVHYGRLDKDHTTTYLWPVTGKEVTLTSRLVVEVALPDGTSFTAYQCMNVLPSGTMYKTDNDKWMFHANGLSCTVYRRVEVAGRTDYLEVYRGIVCESPRKEAR